MHRAVVRRRSVAVGCAVLALVGLLLAANRPRSATSAATMTLTSSSFTFGGGGDFGRGSNATAVLRAIGSDGLSLFASVGDLSYADNTIYPESQWCQYVKDTLNSGAGKPLGDPFGEKFPFQIVSGNHEAGMTQHEGGLIDNYLTPTCLPDRLASVQSPHLGTNPSATGNYGKEYYFDHPAADPSARFLMLSPKQRFLNGGLYDYTAGSARLQWVSDRIDEARAAGIRWIIVGMHNNFISTGSKPDEVGPALFNLLVSKKVDLILQGHDHTYQRSKQLSHSATCPSISGSSTTAANPACVSDDGSDGQYTKGAGPVVLIQGMGGVGYYTTSSSDPHAPYFAKVMGNTSGATGERTYGYNRFTVSDTELSSEFVKGAGGVFSDSFRITDSNPGQPTTAAPTPTPADTTPPNPPGNVVATAVGVDRVNLRWDAATDDVAVQSYEVSRNGAIVGTAAGTTYADATVAAGTTYSYTVRAKDSSGNVSVESAPAVVTTGTSTTLTIIPSDDATVNQASRNTRYGTSATLKADGSPVEHFLLKFTVQGVAGQRIDRAVLRLYVNNGAPTGGVLRATTSTGWTQGAVTWATAPMANGVALGTLGAVTTGRWVEVNVAQLVTGNGTYSIRVSSTSGDGAGYNSRDASTNKPEVRLTVSSP